MKLTPTTIVLGIIAIVIVVLVIIFVLTRQPTQPALTSPPPVTEITPQFANLVEVSSQSATDSATIDRAGFKEGGYVVIHESTPDGAHGEVIGNTDYLEPGDYFDLKISLKKAVKAGATLFAMIHADDGDKTYGFPDEDLPLKDEAGNIILQKYTVTK